MKLINWRLLDEPLSISIEADGLVWDLHNYFTFICLQQDILARSVILSWQPYGNALSAAPCLEIAFTGVDYLEVTPRDSEIPDFGEDSCLSGLSRVSPDDDSRDMMEHGVPYPEDFEDGRFHLWFAFRGGQHIRIGAESAARRTISPGGE